MKRHILFILLLLFATTTFAQTVGYKYLYCIDETGAKIPGSENFKEYKGRINYLTFINNKTQMYVTDKEGNPTELMFPKFDLKAEYEGWNKYRSFSVPGCFWIKPDLSMLKRDTYSAFIRVYKRIDNTNNGNAANTNGSRINDIRNQLSNALGSYSK